MFLVMLEAIDLINLKYIYIILTLGAIGIICIFKELRVGMVASITGIIIITIIWSILKVIEYLKSSMENKGVNYTIFLENIKAIFMAISIFFIIILIYYFIRFLKNSTRKRINKRRGKRRYF